MRLRVPPLADLVQHAREHADGVDDATLLALRAFGTRELWAVAASAIALLMPRLTVHRITPAAADLVRETDMPRVPTEMPPLVLSGAWLLQAKRDQPLVLSYPWIGGWLTPAGMYLIAMDPEDYRVYRVRTADGGVVIDPPSPGFEAADWMEQGEALARWVLTLGWLLDAPTTPLLVEDEREQQGRRERRSGQRGRRPSAAWVTRRIVLGQVPTPVDPGQRPESRRLEREGLHPALVRIRGHVRRQPCGPGRSQRKTVYIAPHTAWRWISDRPVRVYVTASGDGA